MKIGTDGVLLGAWVSLPLIPLKPAPVRILDIGTGTGVIALMMAQRTASLSLSQSQVHAAPMIDAVEIDPAAFEEACGNFARSPWGSVLRGIHMPIQEYAALTSATAPATRYDLIVSNPPYFLAGLDFKRGLCDPSTGAVDTMPSPQRIAARHAELLPYDELIDAVLALLEPEQGRFAAIFPYQESGIFIAKAAAKGLYCHRQLHVQGAPHKPVKRVAAEFSLRRNPKSENQRETLSIEGQNREFSDAYQALTQEFYLHF